MPFYFEEFVDVSWCFYCGQTNVCYWIETLLKLYDYVMFWRFDPAKNAIQGDAPEGSDTL